VTAVRLVDEADRAGRTTATLLASLTARLATLSLISGADAVGALIAGYAALGREVARTADGQRMRAALQSGRPGVNGDTLWAALLIDRWASSMPPSPVLDHLRNDFALLLVDDLPATLELPPMPAETVGAGGGPAADRATAVDFIVGLWAFSKEVVTGVEALAAPTLAPPGEVQAGPPPSPPLHPPMLR
jgi:hypothetical protein